MDTIEQVIERLKNLHDARESFWQGLKDRLDTYTDPNEAMSIALGVLRSHSFDRDYAIQVCITVEYIQRAIMSKPVKNTGYSGDDRDQT